MVYGCFQWLGEVGGVNLGDYSEFMDQGKVEDDEIFTLKLKKKRLLKYGERVKQFDLLA